MWNFMAGSKIKIPLLVTMVTVKVLLRGEGSGSPQLLHIFPYYKNYVQNAFWQSGSDSRWFLSKKPWWNARPPPFMENSILNIHFVFRMSPLYHSPGLMRGTVRCVLWWKAPSYLDFIFTFGTARSRFTQIELIIKINARSETQYR